MHKLVSTLKLVKGMANKLQDSKDKIKSLTKKLRNKDETINEMGDMLIRLGNMN